MKRITLILSLFLFGLYTLSAQEFDDKRDRIKALKIAFITEKLNLTADEATKFWPVYNTYAEKQFELKHRKMRNLMDKARTLENQSKLSEKEASALLTQMENMEEELFNLQKKIRNDLEPIIGSSKVLKLKRVEEEFNRHLLNRVREQRK